MNDAQLATILKSIECSPYFILSGVMGDGWFIQVRMMSTCVVSGQQEMQSGGKLYVSPHCEHGELVRKIFLACVSFAEHETRESFHYRGRRVFGPHIDVNALWHAATDTAVRS